MDPFMTAVQELQVLQTKKFTVEDILVWENFHVMLLNGQQVKSLTKTYKSM